MHTFQSLIVCSKYGCTVHSWSDFSIFSYKQNYDFFLFSQIEKTDFYYVISFTAFSCYPITSDQDHRTSWQQMKSYLPIELDYGEGKLHKFMDFNNLFSDIRLQWQEEKKKNIKMTEEWS